MLQTYRDYRPTAFDPRGLGLDDRQTWLVAGVIQTRDSGVLDQSNFACYLAGLGGESKTVEVHRFGHWGPGWFEIILIDPNSPAAETARELEASLEDYPVLDEMDWSRREYEATHEAWEGMSMRERIEACSRAGVSIFAARHDVTENDRLYEHVQSHWVTA